MTRERERKREMDREKCRKRGRWFLKLRKREEELLKQEGGGNAQREGSVSEKIEFFLPSNEPLPAN